VVPSTSTLIRFCATASVLILLPGPGMLLLVARGVANGRRVAVLSACGVETGTVVYVCATAVGVTALLASSALAFSLVRYVGAAYLVVLGVRTLLGKVHAPLDAAHEPLSARRAYAQAFLIGVTNPKIAIFFLAFFPQFVDPHHGSIALQVFVLGGVFVAMALPVDLLVASTAGSLGNWIRRRPSFARRQRYVAGSVYIALGASAAVSNPSRP
jgi:threonine/homoserine/homoserine lactone efflux protein